MRQLLCLALGTLLASAACGAPPPETTPAPGQASIEAYSVDPLSLELLRRYGLHPAGPTELSSVRIGPPTEPPWDLLLEDSRRIGLDFASLTGTNAQRRTTPVVGNLGPQHECAGCSKGGRVHVLVAGERMIGAWLSDEVTVPGVWALSDVEIWCRDDECEVGEGGHAPGTAAATFRDRHQLYPGHFWPPEVIPPGPAMAAASD